MEEFVWLCSAKNYCAGFAFFLKFPPLRTDARCGEQKQSLCKLYKINMKGCLKPMYRAALFIDSAIYVNQHILKCWASCLTVIGSSAAGKGQMEKCTNKRCF